MSFTPLIWTRYNLSCFHRPNIFYFLHLQYSWALPSQTLKGNKNMSDIVKNKWLRKQGQGKVALRSRCLSSRFQVSFVLSLINGSINSCHYKEKLYLNHFKKIKSTISMLSILKLGLLAMATRLKSNIKIIWIGSMTILLRDQTIISLYITFMGV